jgi:hypothetical protein
MADEKEVERVAQIACDRYQDEIGVDTMRWKGINETMRGYWRAIARAVLAAIPSYAQGWDDAKRRAVENVERVNMFAIGKRSAQQIAVDAIRAIGPQQEGTHESRWLAFGWVVRWSDESRDYLVCRDLPSGDHESDSWHHAPTVQAVDAWIAARKENSR